MSSCGGSITSLMCCATSEGESAPSVSAVLSNDASGAITYSGITRIINEAALLTW